MNFVLLAMALTFGALNHGAIEMARAFIFSKPPGKRTVSLLCLNSFGSEFFQFFLTKPTQVVADVASLVGLFSHLWIAPLSIGQLTVIYLI